MVEPGVVTGSSWLDLDVSVIAISVFFSLLIQIMGSCILKSLEEKNETYLYKLQRKLIHL